MSGQPSPEYRHPGQTTPDGVLIQKGWFWSDREGLRLDEWACSDCNARVNIETVNTHHCIPEPPPPRKDRERKPIKKRGRLAYALAVRQRGLCGICEQPLDEDLSLAHFDHVVPLSKGGADDESNLQLAHAACNLRKGNSLQEQAA